MVSVISHSIKVHHQKQQKGNVIDSDRDDKSWVSYRLVDLKSM